MTEISTSSPYKKKLLEARKTKLKTKNVSQAVKTG